MTTTALALRRPSCLTEGVCLKLQLFVQAKRTLAPAWGYPRLRRQGRAGRDLWRVRAHGGVPLAKTEGGATSTGLETSAIAAIRCRKHLVKRLIKYLGNMPGVADQWHAGRGVNQRDSTKAALRDFQHFLIVSRIGAPLAHHTSARWPCR
jgi:hypothetical protein